LVDALDDPCVGFFVHIDAKSAMPAGLFEGRRNVTLVPRRKVWWGGWSHTAAILTLMSAAAEGDFDYCVTMSGGDYPVRSNETIFRTLAAGGEFINAAPGFRPDKPESRVKYYWFEGFDRRRKNPKALAFRALEKVLKILQIHKRRYPFEQIYVGIVWSALSMGCVRYILDYARTHPRYVAFFRTAQVPEEMFFQTIVGNSPFAKHIKGTLTYMDWNSDDSGPPLITKEHLPRLAPGVRHGNPASGLFTERIFARKFNDNSSDVLDEIDALFRIS
jgi:hypothetical protein